MILDGCWPAREWSKRVWAILPWMIARLPLELCIHWDATESHTDRKCFKLKLKHDSNYFRAIQLCTVPNLSRVWVQKSAFYEMDDCMNCGTKAATILSISFAISPNATQISGSKAPNMESSIATMLNIIIIKNQFCSCIPCGFYALKLQCWLFQFLLLW